MKKLIILLLILLIPLFPKADLTEKQQEDIAIFAQNIILKGNSNEHKTGSFGIFAYNQGSRREGFYNQLSFMGKDYNGVNIINDKKWTFDCSSFAAYVYYHTLGVDTTYHSGHPYVVSKFVEDAHNKKNFYFVMTNTYVSAIDYNKLEKGDLIVIVGPHIMVYIGEGYIAHFSSSAIQRGTNLGCEVTKLSEKYPSTKVSVLRLKDGVVEKNKKVNTIITWPDTGKKEDLTLAIDESESIISKDQKPIINVTYKDIIQKEIEVTIKITDDKGLMGYQLTTSNPSSYESINKKKTFTKKEIIKENGTYYVYAKDSIGQESKYEFKINNLDYIKPTISNVKYKYHDETKKFDIEIIANDNNKIMYSLDKSRYQDSNYFNGINIGEHLIEVMDTAGNIFEYPLNLSSDLIPTLTLTYNTNYAKTITVVIDAKDQKGVTGFAITKDNNEPSVFNPYSPMTTYLITANGTYYFWIKNTNDIVISKNITINNIDNIPPTINNIDIKRDFLSYKIVISATDNECGIDSYSIDGTNYQESNTFNGVKEINENIYVKDKCDNISIYKVDLNNLPTTDYSTIILIVAIIIVSIILIKMLLSVKRK